MDKKEALEIVKSSAYELANLSAKFKKDKEIVLEAVKLEGIVIEFADDSLKQDKEIVLEAVKSNGGAIQFADDNLKNDKEVVLEAIKNDGYALEHLDQVFRKDREVVMLSVKNNGAALTLADDSLKKDREIVVEAIKQWGVAIQYADDVFKKDREVVLMAVEQNGSAIEYVDDSFKKDKEIVHKAVKQTGDALQYVDDVFKKDKKLVLDAVKNFGSSFDYADDKLKYDKDIIIEAVRSYNHNALEYIVDENLIKDRNFILELVKIHGQSLKIAHESLKKDKEIVDAAVAQDESAIHFADKSFKKNVKVNKEIYMKTEPAGRVVFGKFDKKQEESFYKKYSNKEDLVVDLQDLAYGGLSGKEYEGVFNYGENGDRGNEGIIVFDEDKIKFPKKNDKYEDGLYLAYLSLSKASIQFEFELKDKEEFDPEQFQEVSVPVRFPEMIEHERYGNSEFNIIIDCIYKGESLQEFLDAELVDRGYDDLITVIEVKNGEMKKLYSSYNGEGKYF